MILGFSSIISDVTFSLTGRKKLLREVAGLGLLYEILLISSRLDQFIIKAKFVFNIGENGIG